MSNADHPLTGQCLCGAVRFRLEPPLRDVVVCHCRQCAQWTGHAVAMTSVAPDRLSFGAGAGNVGWYQSSTEAQRGFCKTCGSALFWRPMDNSRISVAAGALDPPTGLKIGSHIFVADKSDYFDITDGNPCHVQGSSSATLAAPK